MHVEPDIQLRYEWREGSLPPPHHWEYRLEVRGDQGCIELFPDYPAADRPAWVEAFVVDPDLVANIVRRLAAEELLRGEWQRGDEASPVGGSTEWIVLSREGEEFTIPSRVARENEKARELVAEIRSLVPEPLWDDLMRRRREYEEAWTPAGVTAR